jgi:uncharacterized protein YpuA (DUF1002 family)
VFEDVRRVVVDVLARLGYTRRVPDREVINVTNATLRYDLDFTPVERV